MTHCRECIWGNGINEDGHPVPLDYPKATCKTCGAAPDNTNTSNLDHQATPQFDAPTDLRQTRRHSISSRTSSRPTPPSHAPSGQSTPSPPEHTPSSQQFLRSRRGLVSTQVSSKPPSALKYSASDYSSTIGSQVSYLSGHQYPIPGGPASSVASGRSSALLSMLSTRQAHVGGFRPPSAECSVSGMIARASSMSGPETSQDAPRFDNVPIPDSRAHATSSSRHQRSASMSGSSMDSNDDWHPRHILHVRSTEGSAGRPSQQPLQPERSFNSTVFAPPRGAPSQYVPEPFHGALYTDPVPANVSAQPQQRSRRSSTSSSRAFDDCEPSPSASEGGQNATNGRQHGGRPTVSSVYSGIDSMYSAAPSTAHSQSAEHKGERRRSIRSMHSAAYSTRSATPSSRAQLTYHRPQHASGDHVGSGRGVAQSPYAQSPQDASRFTYNGFVPVHGNSAANGRRAPASSQQDRNDYATPTHSVFDSSQTSHPYNSHILGGSSNVVPSAPGGSTPTAQQYRTSTPTHSYTLSTARNPTQEQYTHFPTYKESARPVPLAQSITAAKVLSHIASQDTASVGGSQRGPSNVDASLKPQDGSAAQHNLMVDGQLAERMATMNIKMAGGTEVKIVEGSQGGKGRRVSFVIEG
ncbi:hypothetical protein EJ03DRAFT_328927 [Teratosphaeria nubilosa]|uniref:Uncharacterized protein n=1 Tax=Teratosphaeria nubilosa TaxID=161662 RepID=A0A6G1L4I7_9PEZI|nr:hypothetical protein EJ03DRAFT_328927 [Teratosphaeria nubilosa]